MKSALLPSGLETVLLEKLKPYADNPRTHSKAQIRQIAHSMETFGWTNPVLVDHEGCIVAGHGRVEAAKLLGMARVPVLLLEHMTEAEGRAYIIADNQLALKAGWDRDLLTLELGWLLENAPDLDIELTGFDTGEIDLLLANEVSDEPAVELPKEDAVAVNCPGDT